MASSSAKRKAKGASSSSSPPQHSKKSKSSSSHHHHGNHKKQQDRGHAPHAHPSSSSTTPLRPRKHADIVVDGKRIWNQLRLKTNTAAQTRALVDELMPLIAGKAHEIALQHDASRVVQAAVQFGSAAERRQILRELCAGPAAVSGGSTTSNNSNNNSMVELCKSQYAHFVVLKVIKYCHTDDEAVKRLTTALQGHMAKLAVHATASRVVEALFQTLSPGQMARLKQEFYGPHFALFAADVDNNTNAATRSTNKNNNKLPTLASNLKAAPERKDVTLQFVRQLVHKGLEKQLYGFSYFQELLLEYLETCSTAEVRSVASTAADHAIHLLSTRSGTAAVARLTAYGTAKDRKRILKSLKGYGRSGLLHRDAYLAVLRLVQLTDDTVSIHKNLLNELLSTGPAAAATTTKKGENDEEEQQDSPLLEIALSETGSKLFLMLLVDQQNDTKTWNKLFDPYEHSVLFPNPVVSDDGKSAAVSTSKKDATVRRQELLQHLREPLHQLCRQHADVLLRSIPGSAVLKHVYAEVGRTAAVNDDGLVEAVLDVCEADLVRMNSSADDDDDKSRIAPIFEDITGHRALKNLILLDAAALGSGDDDQGECFASQFLSRFESRLMTVADSNRGAFVVASLCQVPGLRERVAKAIEKSQIKKRSQKKEGPTAGFAALLKELK